MLITDFLQSVTEKDNLSCTSVQKDKWQVIPYETADTKGKMLFAGECSFPQSVTVALPAEGWHKIYICMPSVGDENGVEVSLLDGQGNGTRTFITPSHTGKVGDWEAWASYEFMEESLFTCADITGKKLRFHKPRSFGKNFTSAVAFIRLEKMAEAEILQYLKKDREKVVAYHFDCDRYWECDFENANDYLGRLNVLENGNGDIFIQESTFDDDDMSEFDDATCLYKWRNLKANHSRYFRQSETVKDLLCARAHELGMDYYAGMRMEMGDFFFPYPKPKDKNSLVRKYPNLRCKTRDGREIMALSYAYKEVRAMVIEKILSSLKSEFDGVSLIFHRGIHIGHEQPVLDAVQARYGIDARILPFADERLHSVLSDFITQFMRELQSALASTGKKYKVNVVVYDTVQDSKNFGIDIERWAKEGLIDSVAQGLMRHYEKLDGCLDENGYIDLKKYEARLAQTPVLRRWYDDTMDVLTANVREFLPLRDYGVTVYGALAWENKPREYQLALAEKFHELGVDKLIAWNANHMAKKLPIIEAVKSIGNADRRANLFRKMHRVLSIDGVDISTYNPNWRG